MNDRPDAEGLLAEARRLLLAEVASGLSGRARYKALMIANTMGIAEREIVQEAGRRETWKRELETLGVGDEKSLVRQLRQGLMGGDISLYRMLLQDAEARTAISNPKRLG